MTDPRSTAEFLERYGDAIDDRVADMLDEYLRNRPAPPVWPAIAVLFIVGALSLAASRSTLVVAAACLSTALIFLSARGMNFRDGGLKKQ